MSLRIKIILLAVVCTLVAAHFLLWAMVSTKGVDILKQSLSRHLGLTVSADRVKFSLLSQAVRIKNLKLSDPADPEAQPVFTAKKVILHFNLFSLFLRRITIKRVLIDYPNLELSRNSEGQWGFPVRRTKPKPPAGMASGPAAPNTGASAGIKPGSRKHTLDVALGKLEIKHGEISFHDDILSPAFWIRLKDIRLKGKFLHRSSLQFTLSGLVDGKTPANFQVRGETGWTHGKWNANLSAQATGIDISWLAPYYQRYIPATVSGGNLFIHSDILCADNVIKESSHSLTLRNFKIHSWNEEFLKGRTFGIPNRELADYLARNGDEISLTLDVSGPFTDFKTMSIRDTLKMMGLSAVNQWFHSGKQPSSS